MAVAEVTRTSRYGDIPDLLQVVQVSAYLGVSKYWVYERVKDGTFTPCDMGTKLIFIPKEQLHPARLKQSEPRVEERRARRLLRNSDPDEALSAVQREQKRRAERNRLAAQQ